MQNIKLSLVFRDTNKIYDDMELLFTIGDHALAQKWTELLIENLFNSNHPIEKTFMLKGWQTTWESNFPRNLEYLCNELNSAIDTINNSDLGYEKITLHYTVEKLKLDNYQSLMNDIHHHFEILIGQVWSVSPWWTKADTATQFAIRQLNNLCHEMESTLKSIHALMANKKNAQSTASIGVSLNGTDQYNNYFSEKKHTEITLTEYSCFKDNYTWGDVIIYYSQLGKRHQEAFLDNDTVIGQENISGHKFLTGEFSVLFCQSSNVFTNDFKLWLTKNNFDYNDISLGLGMPVVASIDMPIGKSNDEILKELRNRNDLYQIILKDHNGNIIHKKVYNEFIV
jgi:hypothetical protein